MLIPVRIQAEVFKHLQVLFDGLVKCSKIIADHQCAGAGHKDHALHVAQINRSAAGDHDFLPRQDKTETGNRLENLQRSQRLLLAERRAFNRIENVNRNDIRPQLLKREGEFAAIFSRFAHAQNSPRTDFNPGLFQVLDGLYAFLIGVRGANLRKKPLRTFEVVIVTLQSGLLEPVGDLLTLDDSQRSVRTRLAALLQFFQPIADFIEHRPFIKPAPGRYQAKGSDPVGLRFVGGPEDWFALYQAVARGIGLIGG